MLMQISIASALSFAYFSKDLELLNFQKPTFKRAANPAGSLLSHIS